MDVKPLLRTARSCVMGAVRDLRRLGQGCRSAIIICWSVRITRDVGNASWHSAEFRRFGFVTHLIYVNQRMKMKTELMNWPTFAPIANPSHACQVSPDGDDHHFLCADLGKMRSIWPWGNRARPNTEVKNRFVTPKSEIPWFCHQHVIMILMIMIHWSFYVILRYLPFSDRSIRSLAT